MRAGTREQHVYLDSSEWLATAIAGLQPYAEHIADVAAFYADAERALAPWEAELTTAGFAPAERRKTAALETERAALRARGFGADAPHATFPEIASFAAAAGCLYVLEGSTLGGMVIAKRIAEQLDWTSSFYGVYGGRTPQMWRAFTTAFDGANAAFDRTELIAGADRIFAAYAVRVAHLKPLVLR